MTTKVKSNRIPYEMEFIKGIAQLTRLALHNNEFALFWLIGVLLHILAFDTYDVMAWIAIACFDWFILGAVAVRSTVRGVEKSFAHCGVSFTQAYGTPKWILADKYPCSADTIEFTACGHPAESYQACVDRIATGLHLPIQRITADHPGAQVLQAHIVRTQIPKTVAFSEIDLDRLEQGQFVYGKTEHGFKFDNLKDAIHMIVAGQVGSGKTYFIQQLAMTILMRSREAHAAIIDMKGGVDFPEFRSLQNCELYTTHESAHQLLDALSTLHDARAKYLVEKGKRNWRDLSETTLS